MKTKILFLLTILSLSIIPVVNASSDDWANSSFHYRNVYVIDSDLIDEQLYDFPVLVYLNSSYIQWDRVNDNLSDLRFYNISNNLLSHELQEDYVVNNEAWLWVKIPYVSNVSDTYFFMYYGCSYAESVENKTGVWDSDFIMVQHMNDNTTSTILDSTINNNDGTKKDANTPIETTGQIGKALDYDNTNSEFIKILDADTLDVTGDGTWEFWVQIDSFPALVSSFLEKTYTREFSIHTYNDGSLAFAHGDASGTEEKSVLPVGSLATGSLIHITVVRDMTAMTVTAYKNGVIGTPQAIIKTPIASADDIYIGMENAANWAHDGKIDEVRISKDIARSYAWVGASYETQRLNLISLTNTETFNQDYMAFGVIAMMFSMFSFVMVITMIKRKGEK